MDESLVFFAAADRAYRNTRAKFESFASNPLYRPYVVPPATEPEVGFAIFYTPMAFRPRLAIVGQNPSNFAGVGAELTAWPNAEMLSGSVPRGSSYEEHDHLFGATLRDAFAGHESLYADSVGMNVWHFQCVSEAGAAPESLRTFCEGTTRDLVAAMQPRHVICFGTPAFKALTGNDSGQRVTKTVKSRVVSRGGASFWLVPHLTNFWTASKAQNDLPIVLSEIARDHEGLKILDDV